MRRRRPYDVWHGRSGRLARGMTAYEFSLSAARWAQIAAALAAVDIVLRIA